MKPKRVAQIIERFILSLSLTRNIDLDALSHKPFFFLPNAGGEFLFHGFSGFTPSSSAGETHFAFISAKTPKLLGLE
jgi:hypothetical protein